MIKQITEQLELPLECVYQMTLVGMEVTRKAKRVAKAIPNIPEAVQLCLELEIAKKTSLIERLKHIGIGVLLGAGTITAGLALLKLF